MKSSVDDDVKGSDQIKVTAYDAQEESKKKSNNSFSAAWTAKIQQVHSPINNALVAITRWSAKNPYMTYYGCILSALGIFAIGFLTNFRIEIEDIWTPMDSFPDKHKKYIMNDAGFPDLPRYFAFTFYNDGENILSERSVNLVFQAIDALRILPDYDSVCALRESGECEITGIPRFWNNSIASFRETVTSDSDAIMAMSSPVFGDGTSVTPESIFGTPIFSGEKNLTSVIAYFVRIALPETDEALDFELEALDAMQTIQETWKKDPDIDLKFEFITERSFDDEFLRAIQQDLLLVPFVFIAMSIFTCAIFVKNDKVQSRSVLGLAAVVSVFLSILTGFGFLFLCGIPFTTMTQILPFVLFGIGLDDAFIMTGAYYRTDPSKAIEDRIRETIEDIGISIVVTTVTSILAFGFGALSKVPAINWLCIYAFFTIACVLFYQVTFYVAAIVLDERRIQDKRRDCATCLRVRDGLIQVESETQDHQPRKSSINRIMYNFARLLLLPPVKFVVIVSFAGLTFYCAYSVSKLEQKFDFTDILPSDSYVTQWLDQTDAATVAELPIAVGVYFRYVNQSEPDIQDQMENYVNDLTTIQAIRYQPSHFWLRDFRKFVGNNTNGTFNEQLDQFLDNEVYSSLYDDDIVRDENGKIIVSRCFIFMDNVDWSDVKDQINALEDQRSISRQQPANEGRGDDWAFFAYEESYAIWQFYANAVDEIILTAFIGVIAVSIVALALVPHWTAAVFVLPLICVLYIDLLGFMQWFGVNVDVVVYVSLVMSIGLLVDFVMHTLLRYYESPGTRAEKVVEMLSTMGGSILTGAVSTFLGVVPLFFSASVLFSTIFVAFLGMVLIGSAHGLILLPVLLSIFGPEDQVTFAGEETSLDVEKEPKSLVDKSEEERSAMEAVEPPVEGSVVSSHVIEFDSDSDDSSWI